MTAWGWRRTLVTALFVVFGLPPGLCSFYFTPGAYEMLRHPEGNWDFWTVTFLPWVIGLAMFGTLLAWLIATWRRAPAHLPTPER